jgi:hypothetical protein
MAFLTIATIAGEPGDLLERYLEIEPLMTGVGRDHGLLVHAVATTPDGLLQVNLWPSRDGSQAAANDRRRVAVVGALDVDIRREHYDVPHHVLFQREAQMSRA